MHLTRRLRLSLSLLLLLSKEKTKKEASMTEAQSTTNSAVIETGKWTM